MMFASLLRFGVIFIPGYVFAIDVTPAEKPVENSYIVTLDNSNVLSSSSLGDFIDGIIQGGEIGGQSHGTVNQVYDSTITGFAAELDEKGLQNVLNNKNVLSVEQDGYVQLDQVTWGLDRIDDEDLPLDKSYEPTFGNNGEGVTAYIIDTGVLHTHKEFENRATQEYNSVGDGKNYDCHGHGTHVAGTVGSLKYGVANKAKIVGVKVLSCSGGGTWSGVIGGVNWVAKNAKKPATANMSLGGGKNTALNAAVKALVASGVSTVVAAGNNNGDACAKSPASEPDAITVGATTSSDARASFSNWGTCVDIFAPGQSITAPWIGSSNTVLRTISGTSMASPHVCGGAALYLGQNPNLTPTEIVNKMLEDSIANTITNVGSGSPNKFLYVAASQSPTVSPAPTLAPTSPAPTKTPPKNLAKGKPTKQSSTDWGGSSKRAVDGNTNGSWSSGSVTHTRRERKPWWEVDLEKAFSIDTVIVYNRSDCCSERLSNFKVIIMHRGKEAYSFHYTARAPQKTTFTTPKSIKGDKVKVELQGYNYLSLAEVEVYGQSTAVKKCSTNGKKCLSVEKLSYSSSEDDLLKVKFDFRPMMKWQKDTKQVVVVKGGEKPNNSNTYGVKNVRRRKQTLLFDLASLVSKMPGGVGPLDIYFVKKGTVVFPETMISVNVSA